MFHHKTHVLIKEQVVEANHVNSYHQSDKATSSYTFLKNNISAHTHSGSFLKKVQVLHCPGLKYLSGVLAIKLCVATEKKAMFLPNESQAGVQLKELYF